MPTATSTDRATGAFMRGDLAGAIRLHVSNQVTAADDAAAVVGAYAWTGRMEEAHAVDAAFRRRFIADPAYLAMARCWLAIGWCHAGRVKRARQLLRDGDEPRDRDSFYWLYPMAFVAYFRGRIQRSARWGRRALHAAVVSENRFGQLLANDLLAHAAHLLGRRSLANRLLTHASSLAVDLQLPSTYHNLQCNRALFAVTDAPGDPVARQALAQHARAEGLHYFSKRHALSVLAMAHALVGEQAIAADYLREATEISVGHDARGDIRVECGRGVVAAVSGDRATADAAFARALASALTRRHIDLAAEVGFLRRLLLQLGSRELPARSDIGRLCWARDGHAPEAASKPSGDRLLSMAASWGALPDASDGWRRAGLFGVAAALSPPGSALILRADGVLLRTVDASTFVPYGSPVAQALVAALASGPQKKSALVHAMWGIRTYHPHLHDGPLYTAVSRLRQRWGLAGAWIERTTEGYQLRADIEVSRGDQPASIPAAGLDPTPRSLRLTDRVLRLAQRQPLTSGDAAKALNISTSTALRVLRTLVSGGQLIRIGTGAQTRYGAPR